MIGDALQNVAQIELWIEAVKLGGAEQGIGSRGAVTTGVRSGKEIVLTAQSYGTQGAFRDW
jgi:hypothetical protein